MDFRFPNQRLLRFAIGDLARRDEQVLVTEANELLLPNRGVDSGLRLAAGPSLSDELARVRQKLGGRCRTGGAVATGAGRLPARRLVHAVAPLWQDGQSGEWEGLAEAYRSALTLVGRAKARSAAFAPLGTVAAGHPVPDAARVAIVELGGVLGTGTGPLRETTLVLSSSELYVSFCAVWDENPLHLD